jgi:hypothetical protein
MTRLTSEEIYTIKLVMPHQPYLKDSIAAPDLQVWIHELYHLPVLVLRHHPTAVKELPASTTSPSTCKAPKLQAFIMCKTFWRTSNNLPCNWGRTVNTIASTVAEGKCQRLKPAYLMVKKRAQTSLGRVPDSQDNSLQTHGYQSQLQSVNVSRLRCVCKY